jgi:AhpD family alkylhydroperoxidase
MPTQRLPHPADLIPEARTALTAVTESIAGAGVDGKLLALCQLLASQLNGCDAGVAARAQRHGATPAQVHAVAAWRTAPWFSDPERAALAVTEAVTRLADRPDPVPDQLWDLAATHFDQRELAALLLTIAITNAVNRLDAPIRKDPVMSTKTTAKYDGFTDEERGAMKARASELKAAGRRGAKADPEAEVLAKIAEMSASDRAIAERLHAVIRANAPSLTPKLWYGMPAYARDGKVLCHFQSAAKFRTRYATLGFSAEANLDDGAMWPTSFALPELTAEAEKKIGALVKRAVS